MRIFEIARDCGVKSDAIIDFLKSKGIEIKTRMQPLTADQEKLVLAQFKTPPAPAPRVAAPRPATADGRPRTETQPRRTDSRPAPARPGAPSRPGQPKPPASPVKRGPGRRPMRRIPLRKDKAMLEEDIFLKKIMDEQMRKQKEDESKLDIIEIQDPIIVRDLAKKMNIDPAPVLKKLVEGGFMCTLNQPLDAETASTIALEFGFEARVSGLYSAPEKAEDADTVENLKPRPPIVTIMGHVDHGKTSLLDKIRKTDVASGEAGGITQHIGASLVTAGNGKTITFLDTPGHEAFTAMRARGAQVTDIVVLVVAADDGIMPQTIEAIRHAQNANCPIIVAINKCDIAGVNPDRIKQQMVEYNLAPEDWGGKTIYVKVSARTGENLDQLLEMILLQAEMMELKANPDRPAQATVIESRVDPKIGIFTMAIVQRGTLKPGDSFVVGSVCGRVRNMYNDKMEPITAAGPSTSVVIIGCDELPDVGDKLNVAANDKEARSMAQQRKDMTKADRLNIRKKITLEEVSTLAKAGEKLKLNIILKADRKGSVEALTDMLLKLSNDDVSIHLIATGAGAINDGDVLLASAARALIVGFQVRTMDTVEDLAKREGVEVRIYDIIYQIIDDVTKAMKGMLSPEIIEELVGKAEVRQLFKVSHIGTVAGCIVSSGLLNRKCKIKVIRDGTMIYESTLSSLKRFKDDAREVREGFECGLMVDKFNDLKVGDLIEGYLSRQVAVLE